jgi:hypothetical protein
MVIPTRGGGGSGGCVDVDGRDASADVVVDGKEKKEQGARASKTCERPHPA